LLKERTKVSKRREIHRSIDRMHIERRNKKKTIYHSVLVGCR